MIDIRSSICDADTGDVHIQVVKVPSTVASKSEPYCE